MSTAKRMIEKRLEPNVRKRKKYLVGGKEYSMKALREKVFSLVENYCGDRFTNVYPDHSWIMNQYDSAFIGEALSYHEEYEQIRGAGIAAIKVCYVGPQKGRPHYGIAVVRVDGTEQITGVNKLGFTKSMLSKSRFREACRHAVKEQTIEYKEMYFDGHDEAPSEISGDLIRRNDCEVDHMPPTFDELVRCFFGDQEYETFDDGMCWRIMDKDVRDRWAEYHRQHAQLRCISRQEHYALKGR